MGKALSYARVWLPVDGGEHHPSGPPGPTAGPDAAQRHRPPGRLVISGALLLMATGFAAASLGTMDGLVVCILLFSVGEVLIDPCIDKETLNAGWGLQGYFAGLCHYRSCHGTFVTATPRTNSSEIFRRNAVWLCSRCSHQCATRYSGMKTLTRVPGCSRTSWRT